MRVGFGYDIHRLAPGRRLFLAGVEIPSSIGPEAHSDGDVLLHALIDALLGASGLGDIGQMYPPEAERYRGVSSRLLLSQALAKVKAAGFRPLSMDSTVVLQSPRILPYVDRMKENLSADLGLPMAAICVKGKTKEGVDATGEGRAVEAYAVVLLEHL